MSGRKASEVNGLLRNGEQTRSASMDILKDAYKNAKLASDKLKESYVSAKDTINAFDFKIPSEVYSEFPDAAAKYEMECNDFLKEFNTDSYEVSFDESGYNKLLDDYKSTDKKADNIRKKISDKIRSDRHSDPWYCDDEYRCAEKVENEYRSLAAKVNSIRGEYNTVKSKAANKESVLNCRAKRAKELKESVCELTKKANDAIKTRQQAQSCRDKIKAEVSTVSKDIAEKFMASQFNELSEEVVKYTNLSDSEVIKRYSAMSQKISVFDSELNKVFNAYLERQGKVKAMIDDVFSRINNKIFSEPEDEFKPENKRREKMTLTEFLSKTGSSDKSSAISEKYNSIVSSFEKDNFDAAESSLTEINGMLEESLSGAVLTHQNMKKTIYNMLSIKKVMLKMNYDVKVTKNGDFLNDGYSIECSAGDEIIKYDRVAVVDDGNPVIDIDHKESVKGTCHSKWKDIRSELSAEGIIIEDITKNGQSIFGKPPVQSIPDSGTVQNG